MKFFDEVKSYFEFRRDPNHPMVPLLKKYLKQKQEEKKHYL